MTVPPGSWTKKKRRAEELLDALDPTTAAAEGTEDLREIAQAADEGRLTEAVEIVRARS